MRVEGAPGLDFKERCRRAFLGLALGDAHGRPFEFVDCGARDLKFEVGPDFRWTDDTHVSLHLAEAVLSLPTRRLQVEAFAEAVGEQFVLWLHDPLTPSTAPGRTCLEGARNWENCRDWQVSGSRQSDGCGAVMRVGPLPMAFEGEELVVAARVSAAITHAHPNAIEATVAAAWLTRCCLEDGALSATRVAEAATRLRGCWSEGGVVADALDAALAFAATDANWLDEDAIPTGDGGWRSASALGLAVAAALRWGPDFSTAIDKASRIDGDSDSVACITGLVLGACGCALPEPWLQWLPERSRIERLAAALAG